ncbi:MAG: hypothetical protein IB618_01335 [Candidatus Pacearchaeota archaeon]|nr:MAG: hypothetical protein IB618_01335 [Candidatus Pacearchaeota archaeon]
MKRLFFIALIVIISIPLVIAGTQHGVNGFVKDSPNGVSPNGLDVVFDVSDGINIYCTLHDIVGKNGNSGLDNWYAVDIGNCAQQWGKDDIVYIFIGNSTHNVSTQVTLSEFGNDQAPDTQLGDPSFCGDGNCNNATGETCANCPQDCIPQCNNNSICEPIPNSTFPYMCENSTNCIDCQLCNMNLVCEPSLGENCSNCPIDCHCPDGLCQSEYNETNITCFEDCPCGNGICDTIIGPCGSYNETSTICLIDCPGCICGNYICEPDCGENHVNCPSDCNGTCNYNGICEFGEFYAVCPDCPLYCGNMVCDIELGETPENCPSDCGDVVCGDGFCDTAAGENWENCPTDCYGLVAKCGDGTCELAETSENCCVDCGCLPTGLCTTFKCERNRCIPQCCLAGFCCNIYVCWYYYILIIIIMVVLIIILARRRKQKLKKKKLEKVPKKQTKKK